MKTRIREIPYNYTSFSDKEIVLRFLGAEAWQMIEQLRASRGTGRSARMLYEVLGDMWVIKRNPFIQEDLIENAKRRDNLIKALYHRLNQVESRLDGNELAAALLEKVLKAVVVFEDWLTSQKALRERTFKTLCKITHKDNIDFSGLARISHATDATDWRVELPLVVIAPDTEDEVLAIVKACMQLELTMIPRGGGTGYTGSAIPLQSNTAVINTEKLEFLSTIEKIQLPGHPEGQFTATIRTGAGVVTRRVEEAAERADLIFAVDPTSIDASTIGGNISMNAGGKKAVRWGTTLDNLASWKMVTPRGTWLEVVRENHNLGKIHDQANVVFIAQEISSDGHTPLGEARRILMPGSAFRKEGLGKDVTDKFLSGLPGIQKEGCDGLITSARFVLHPSRKFTRTLCFEFFGSDLSTAVPAIDEMTQFMDSKAQEGILLTGLEHLDERYIKAVKYTTKSARRERPKMILLADIECDDEAALMTTCQQLIDKATARGADSFMATSPEARKRFWADRSRTAAISAHTNAFKINEDVVIPIPRLNDYNMGIETLNIEASIQNKIACLQAMRDFMQQDADRVLAEHDEEGQSVESDGIWADKKNHVIQVMARAQLRWTLVLANLSKRVIDLPEVFDADTSVDAFNPEDRLIDLLLRRDWRISMRREVMQVAKNTLGGQDHLAVLEALQAIHKEYRNNRLFIALHMHAGDGNVHTNIPVHSSNYQMLEEADRLVDRIMALAKSLGGVISGEHGIGLTKIQYLEKDKLDAFVAYKKQVDPHNHFNAGKLMPGSGLEDAYTPSLSLVKQEALILEATELDQLNDDIKDCLRCGKCKPVCQTHIPRANLLYSPRNKILATGSLIEAFLYEEQTRRGISIQHFDAMNDVADHCTTCHHCYNPCPVDIDFGDVTIKMRKILTEQGHKKLGIGAQLAFLYLNSRAPFAIRIMRKVLLGWAAVAQRMGYRLFKTLGLLGKKGAIPAASNKKASISVQVINFVRNPLDTGPNKAPVRALLGLEEPDYVPIISDPTKVKDDSDAVFYFPGCGSERLFSDIGLATLAMLSEAGAQTVLPPGYLCCGYPQTAAGNAAKGNQITTENRALFHRVANTLNYMDIKTVIVSCGTCLDQLLKYEFEQIFPGSRMMDIHEYLMEKGLKLNAPTGVKYMYHEPCHSPMKIHDSIKVASTLMNDTVIKSDRCCSEAGTLAVSRPDIATQLRFRKEEELFKGIKELTGEAKKVEKGQVKVLTSCPACQQGLNRYADSTGIETDYIVVEMAANWLGEHWQERFIEQVKKGGVEKVLL